jgi:malonate transporter MadL subunit
MTIYGVGLLAFCYLTGQLLGELLGKLLHIDANVGGVGFAMILLIAGNEWLSKRNMIKPLTQQGVLFWSAMYIPVIVAMSSIQNVKAAFSGGYVALLAGIIPTVALILLVPVFSKLSKQKQHD